MKDGEERRRRSAELQRLASARDKESMHACKGEEDEVKWFAYT